MNLHHAIARTADFAHALVAPERGGAQASDGTVQSFGISHATRVSAWR